MRETSHPSSETEADDDNQMESVQEVMETQKEMREILTHNSSGESSSSGERTRTVSTTTSR